MNFFLVFKLSNGREKSNRDSWPDIFANADWWRLTLVFLQLSTPGTRQAAVFVWQFVFRYRYIAAVFCAGSFFSVFRPAICSCHLVAISAVCFAGISFTETPRLPLIHADLSFCESWIRSILALITFFFYFSSDGCQRENAQGRLCLVPLHAVVCMHLEREASISLHGAFVVSCGPRSRCFLYIQQKVKERLFATREMWKAMHFYRILARVPFWKNRSLCQWHSSSKTGSTF